MWVDKCTLPEFLNQSQTYDCTCWPSSLSRVSCKNRRSNRRLSPTVRHRVELTGTLPVNEILLVSLLADGAGLVLLTAVMVLRTSRAKAWQRELVVYALRFPHGLEPAKVTAFFNGLSGLVASRWRRAIEQRGVVLELSATAEGIEHRLLVPTGQSGFVLATLRAVLPGVTATRDESYRPSPPTAAAGLGLSHQRRPLAVERAAEISAAVLAAVQPLATGEQVVVQWVICPTGPLAPVTARTRPSGSRPFLAQVLHDVTSGRELDGQDLQLARAKQALTVFAATGRIGVVAADLGRARRLLGLVLGVHHTANAPGVHLYRRRLPQTLVARALVSHRLPLTVHPCTLNAAELTALAAFPLGGVSLPGLRLAGCRQLAPAADIPSRGRVLAQATFPGSERPLALSVPDSLRHLHVIGPTGSGKSTLLVGLITQDMAAGHGVVVLDPKGDLVADILDRVPPGRVRDVIVLDPTDDERPVGLNLLAGADDAAELVVEQVVGIFHQLYRAFWGPRTDDILRAALLTLVSAPDTTLCEVPLLLTDAGFRRRLVGRVDDPVGLDQFWGWFEGLGEGERAQATGPVQNKMRAFLLRRRLRNMLGQARPRLDFDRVLAERRILLVPLAKGLLGEEAAALVGSLVVARLWQAVQRRAGLPPDRRPATFAVIDEAQDYLHLPTDVADVLAQARGLGLGLTLAHQHLAQLPPALQAAILANARSRVMFQLSAGDAKTLARELAPHLGAADLQGLGAYEVVASLSAGARVAPPATAITRLPPPPTGQGAAARQHSRERYGAAREEVEAAIRARHAGRPGPGAVGRREVPS